MTKDDERGAGPSEPEVGSVADEAAKLLGALQDWATESGVGQARGTARGMAEGLSSIGDHVGHGQDCRYCPLCQAVRLVRETSPEVRENLALAVSALAQAATAALRQPDRGDAGGDTNPGPHHVDLDD